MAFLLGFIAGAGTYWCVTHSDAVDAAVKSAVDFVKGLRK